MLAFPALQAGAFSAVTANCELTFCVALLYGKATGTVTQPSTAYSKMIQDNTSGQYLRTDDDGSRAEAANFSEFLEICLDRSPVMRGASSQGNRIEPKLLLNNPQETCLKALF
jgi:hypothetical protein